MRDIADEVLEHLRVLERALGVRFEKQSASAGEPRMQIREPHAWRYNDVTADIFGRVRADHDLRLPHRKIIDVLAGRIDVASGEFLEVPLKVVVREARVGKASLGEYLHLLQLRGWVVVRSDGYRKYVRLVTRPPTSAPEGFYAPQTRCKKGV